MKMPACTTATTSTSSFMILQEPTPGFVSPHLLSLSFGGGSASTIYVSQTAYTGGWANRTKCTLIVNALFCVMAKGGGGEIMTIIPLTDIIAVNVSHRKTSAKVHFKTARCNDDWLFTLSNSGSHADYAEVLLALDKLRMLCMPAPQSLSPWGRIVPKEVRKQTRGAFAPPQLLEAYSAKKIAYPRRLHQSGDVVLKMQKDEELNGSFDSKNSTLSDVGSFDEVELVC